MATKKTADKAPAKVEEKKSTTVTDTAAKKADNTPVKSAAKTETKSVAAKEEVKKAPVAKAAEEKKEPAKKAEVKKAEPKTAKKTKPFSKKDIPYAVTVEHAGRGVNIEDIKPRVLEAWQKAGKRIRDIKNIELYIQPEENKVYFVINGDNLDGASIDLFM